MFEVRVPFGRHLPLWTLLILSIYGLVEGVFRSLSISEELFEFLNELVLIRILFRSRSDVCQVDKELIEEIGKNPGLLRGIGIARDSGYSGGRLVLA